MNEVLVLKNSIKDLYIETQLNNKYGELINEVQIDLLCQLGKLIVSIEKSKILGNTYATFIRNTHIKELKYLCEIIKEDVTNVNESDLHAVKELDLSKYFELKEAIMNSCEFKKEESDFDVDSIYNLPIDKFIELLLSTDKLKIKAVR